MCLTKQVQNNGSQSFKRRAFVGSVVGFVAIAVGGISGPATGAERSTSTRKRPATKQQPSTTKRVSTTVPRVATSVVRAPVTTRSEKVVVYSGRAERLVKPLFDTFRFETGIDVEVRYADSSQLAATLIEEGSRTKAAVFFSQDAGALGALSKRGLLATVPANLLQKVPAQFRSAKGEWVGVSGRSRVFLVDPRQAPIPPDSVDSLLDPKWRGKIGFVPTNASWHSFVTALRQIKGEAGARTWLVGLKANNPRTYASNALAAQAADRGDVAIALVNHYYLYELAAGDLTKVTARNAFAQPGDAGALVNVAGVGILKNSAYDASAVELIEFLLSKQAQEYFAQRTYEYPLISTVRASPELPPLSNLGSPLVDLSDLDTIDESLKLLREVGLL